MTIDRYTKILMTVFTFALFLNALTPWTHPPDAAANENTAIAANNNGNNCASARENSIKNLKAVNNVERLLGYIESSINEVKLTVKGIDRKMNEMPSVNSADRRR